MPKQANKLRDQYLNGMSYVANSVSVLTTDGSAGRAGVTVSAMSSVSVDSPRPTLLVCVHQECPAVPKIQTNGVFCVNLLRDDQIHISDTFAGKKKNSVQDKFDCTDWVQMPTGSPRIEDSFVSFDCTVLSAKLVGTHHVIFGEVGEIYSADAGNPLVYTNRSYAQAKPIKGDKTDNDIVNL